MIHVLAGLPLVATLNLQPGSWLLWIIVGLISGAVAARVVAGRGFGCIADIVVGVAGAFLAGRPPSGPLPLDRPPGGVCPTTPAVLRARGPRAGRRRGPRAPRGTPS